jgi:hypothetical protein
MPSRMMAPQFLVFSGAYYYSIGGWYDFVDSFSDKDEAIAFAKGLAAKDHTWAQVVDLHKGGPDKIIYPLPKA